MTKKRSLVSLPLFVLLVLVVMFEQQQQRNNNIVMVVDAFQPTTTRTRGAHHPNRSTTTTTVGSRMMRFFVRRFPGSTLQMTATADTTTTRNRPQLDDNNHWIPAGRNSDINDDDLMMPQLGNDGLYHILTKEQHVTLLQRFPHHIIVFKYYSPWCRACKAMESKYTKIIREIRNNNNIDNNNNKQQKQLLPIIWADMTFKGNREYFESIDVKALPTIQFYIGNTVFDTFGCAPEKIPLLKTKLNAFINEHVDTTTNRLKESSIGIAKKEMVNFPAAVPQTMKAERRSTTATATTETRRTSTPSEGSTSTTLDHHVVDQDQLLDELVARLQEAARQAQMRRKGNNSSSGGSTTKTTTTSPLATP